MGIKSDLSKVKVGDKIWTIADGWCEVKSTDYDPTYPVQAGSSGYTFTGLYATDDHTPSAFVTEPIITIPKRKVKKEAWVAFFLDRGGRVAITGNDMFPQLYGTEPEAIRGSLEALRNCNNTPACPRPVRIEWEEEE